MRLGLVASFAAAISTSVVAESFEGNLLCTRFDEDAGAVVVYVNGIMNSEPTAWANKRNLSRALIDVCARQDCTVDNYYNSSEGFLLDNFQIALIDQIDRQARRLAVIETFSKVLRNYSAYRKETVRLLRQPNGTDYGIDGTPYDDADRRVRSFMLRVVETLSNDRLAGSNEFLPAGATDFSAWFVDLAKREANLPGAYNSIYTDMVLNGARAYDTEYTKNHGAFLVRLYLRERDQYADDLVSVAALEEQSEGLATYLEELVLGGKRVVVVAHSQGNHLTNLAYQRLSNKWGGNIAASLKVVGVGSVSFNTPSNTYISSGRDRALLVARTSGVTQAFPPANFTGAPFFQELMNHGFTAAYLNRENVGDYDTDGIRHIPALDGAPVPVQGVSSRTVITGLVESALAASTPVSASIDSDALLTASLRWEKWRDMDLHVGEESDGSFMTTVKFNNKEGQYGDLDRDDTDGDGPEHYRTRISCAEASGKTFTIGVQQWQRGGGAATTHFNLKLGNARVLSSTRRSDAWPASVVPLAEVRFSNLRDGPQQTLGYRGQLFEGTP